MTDLELVERIKRGEDAEAAWAVLRERYDRKLRAVVARWVSSWDDLDEVVDRTFNCAFQRIHTLDLTRCAMLTWLCGIARNKWMHVCSENQRDRQRFEPYDDELCPDPRPGPEEEHEKRCLYAELHGHLLEMPDLWRQVVLLRHGERLGDKEVARRLKTTVRHVRYVDGLAMAALRAVYGVKPKAESPAV